MKINPIVKRVVLVSFIILISGVLGGYIGFRQGACFFAQGSKCRVTYFLGMLPIESGLIGVWSCMESASSYRAVYCNQAGFPH